jgi:hypothetical protein
MSGPTVACVLRASRDFRPEYVVRLYEAVREHWTGDLDFLCLTDTPIGDPRIREQALQYDWPGFWSKLEFFRPDIRGDLLTFDLDTMIVGSLEGIQANTRHAMLRRLKRQNSHQLASGMMFLPEAVRPPIWQHWIRDPALFMRAYKFGGTHGRPGGDQGFLQQTWERWGLRPQSDPTFDYNEWNRLGIARWQELYPGQIWSYKYQIAKRGHVPPDARVVLFHGSPRPHEIGWTLPKGGAA